GEREFELHLQDWFIPTLYQNGDDKRLLKKTTVETVEIAAWHNLRPSQLEHAFFGRARELWELERWMLQGVQRITIAGFDGQGKTALAIELAYWLQQKGWFEKLIFIDYKAFQGVDAVSYAVSSLAMVLDENLLDAQAAQAALAKVSSFIILDNVESLQAETLAELLTVVSQWSQHARIVLTTCQISGFNHADFPIQNSLVHRHKSLEGLGEADAVAYLQYLLSLRSEIDPDVTHDIECSNQDYARLLGLVRCHPLSIQILAYLLKNKGLAQIEKDLAALPESPDNPVLALLPLFIAHLDEKTQQYLPLLGVFQGGAMEDMILKVMGLTTVSESPEVVKARKFLTAVQNNDTQMIARIVAKESANIDIPEDIEVPQELIEQLQPLMTGDVVNMLAAELKKVPQQQSAEGVDDSIWHDLKQHLLSTDLIQAEQVFGQTYLHFHPTLSAALASDNAEFRQRHQDNYYEFSDYLYFEDDKNPLKAHTIAKYELPNLLFALKGALEDASDDAVEFLTKITMFLDGFGLQRDLDQFNQQAEKLAQQVGTDNWFINKSRRGEQLYDAGHYAEAAEIFTEISNNLDSDSSYRHCVVLNFLGRCFNRQGQAESAIACYQQGLDIAKQLEQNVNIQCQLYADLADVLTEIGDYQQAKTACEQSLAISEQTGDAKAEAITKGQLGTLALAQEDLVEAEKCYQAALASFHLLNESGHEATALYQLGMLYQTTEEWDAAEHAYQKSAKMKEAEGNLVKAAEIWSHLAIITENMGKLADAEAWYRKAIEVDKQFNNAEGVASGLNNLANLLLNQPGRLAEAQQLAQQCLEIFKTLDPSTAEIWKVYYILEQVADKQGDLQTAKHYRALSQQAKANFAGTRYELKREHSELILGTVAAISNAEIRKELEAQMKTAPDQWNNFKTALQQILAGERDEEILCEPLDLEDSMIVYAILEGIENPDSLS
ncbi:MAG: tetratricopeptide repeat protein, partial [Thiotrichaceae bacterium]|nr:tetratricopeptide repeat protein [Thiotrichaceae bacterium]